MSWRLASSLRCLLCVGVMAIASAGCVATQRMSAMQAAAREAQSGDYEAAAQACRQILASGADEDAKRPAHLLLARLYATHLGRVDEALAIYRSLIDRYPRHPSTAEALWVLGSHAYGVGDDDSARRMFLRIVYDFPGSAYDANARIWLAAVHERLGSTHAAADVYIGFADKYAADPRAMDARSRAAALTAGASLPPPDPTALVPLATPVTPEPQPTRHEAAPLTMQEARRRDDAPTLRSVGPQTRPSARAELASWGASTTFGHNARALLTEGGLFGGEDLRQDLASQGANLDDAILALGMLFYHESVYDKAGACLEKAEELGVREIEMYAALTACYLRVGAGESALATLEQAAVVDERVVDWMVDFARARVRDGENELALRTVAVLRKSQFVDEAELETVLGADQD